jgi:hypothetical protein
MVLIFKILIGFTKGNATLEMKFILLAALKVSTSCCMCASIFPVMALPYKHGVHVLVRQCVLWVESAATNSVCTHAYTCYAQNTVG